MIRTITSVLLPFLFVLVAASQEKKARENVPGQEALQKAEKSIKEIFKAEYAKKKAADQIDLAKKLLAQSVETNDDLAAKFVLLREARDLASKAGDVELAIKAVDEMSRRFAVSALENKQTALDLAEKSSVAVPINKSVVEHALDCVDLAVSDDNYDLAEKFLKIAQSAGAKSKMTGLNNILTNRTLEVDSIRKEFDKVKLDLKTLESKPDDPDASQSVGKFLCFHKGDWSAGLPRLAKCGDAKLKALAGKDLAAPKEASERVEVGDGWWDLGESLDRTAQTELRLRAFFWYKQAIDDLKGLTKTRVEKRIADMEKVAALRKHETISPWTVLFRSSDPKNWNKNLKGKEDFAVPLKTAPEEMKYLKMTEMKKNRYVIIELTKERLDQQYESDGYGWQGKNFFDWDAYHLGIYSLEWNTMNRGDVILASPEFFQGYRGWGFGSRNLVNKSQGYTWGGDVLAGTMVFEISVKTMELSAEESKHLLKKKKGK